MIGDAPGLRNSTNSSWWLDVCINRRLCITGLFLQGDLPPGRLHTGWHAGQIPNLVSWDWGKHILLLAVAACWGPPVCMCAHVWKVPASMCERASLFTFALVVFMHFLTAMNCCHGQYVFMCLYLFVHVALLPPLSPPLLRWLQLHGDATSRPGSGPHHEEAHINWSHHHIPVLPAAERTQGKSMFIYSPDCKNILSL